MILANESVTAGGDRNPNPNPREGHSSLRETPYDIRSWGIENNLKYSGEAVNLTPVTAYHCLKATHTGDAGIVDRTGFFLRLYAIGSTQCWHRVCPFV